MGLELNFAPGAAVAAHGQAVVVEAPFVFAGVDDDEDHVAVGAPALEGEDAALAVFVLNSSESARRRGFAISRRWQRRRGASFLRLRLFATGSSRSGDRVQRIGIFVGGPIAPLIGFGAMNIMVCRECGGEGPAEASFGAGVPVAAAAGDSM